MPSIRNILKKVRIFIARLLRLHRRRRSDEPRSRTESDTAVPVCRDIEKLHSFSRDGGDADSVGVDELVYTPDSSRFFMDRQIPTQFHQSNEVRGARSWAAQSVTPPFLSAPSYSTPEPHNTPEAHTIHIFLPNAIITSSTALSVTLDSTDPWSTDGDACDLFLGKFQGITVVLKRPRTKGRDDLDDQDIKIFLREADAWSTLNHTHLLPFIGVGMLDGHIYLVSPFVSSGSIMTFLRRDPKADRLRLLREAADGIRYLHSKDIMHGDIKGSNILVSDDVHALVCDFGLSKLTNAKTATTREGAGSVRWQAPELWNKAHRSEKTDVYSFGITIAEVLSGEIPFKQHPQSSMVVMAVMLEGDRPEKSPVSSPDGVSYQKAWDVAERCWDLEPSRRPNMAQVSELLSTA